MLIHVIAFSFYTGWNFAAFVVIVIKEEVMIAFHWTWERRDELHGGEPGRW